MRVQVTDTLALRSPLPRNIRLYLQTYGWERPEGRQRGLPDVWSLERPEGTYEVIAPSRTATDYPERVGELLRTLSIVEDRSEQDILSDLQVLNYDIQYVHTWYEEGPPGTAPLRDAAKALEAAHGMLSAAATTVDGPRLVLPSRRPTATNQLMRRVLAGPTDAGSYVMSIWVPIPPLLTQEEDQVLFDPAGDPPERIATKRLHQALDATRLAAHEVLDEDASIDAFTDRAESGVSANLCESLVTLSGDSHVPFDVRFTWALARPFPEAPRVVSFDPEIIPVLEQAAVVLRAEVPEDEVRIQGPVVRLHREGSTGPGDVTIDAMIDDEPGRIRRIQISLSQGDYNAAIAAHQKWNDIEIAGSLTTRGTRTYLRSAHDFRVLSDYRD